MYILARLECSVKTEHSSWHGAHGMGHGRTGQWEFQQFPITHYPLPIPNAQMPLSEQQLRAAGL